MSPGRRLPAGIHARASKTCCMNRRVLLAALAFALLPSAGARAESSLTVYAHRGGAGLAPENTMGAFRQAWMQFGAKGVWLEMDGQLSKDGELVIIHDPTLDRTSVNCAGRVMDKSLAELQTCDMRKGWLPGWTTPEPLPTARQVLQEGRAAGWRLFFELKNIPGEANFDPTGEQAAAVLLALVAETGFPASNIVVQSFFPTSLDYIELHSSIATALLTTSSLPAPGAPPGAGFTATENGAYATARGYEVSAPDVGSLDMGAAAVAAVQALGRKVVVWTVDTLDDIAAARSWGVDGIISNRPDLVYG